MSATKRRLHPRLIDQLIAEPYRFEFFQAVRLLLAYHVKYHAATGSDVLGQVIRFRNSISLAFPPSEIEALECEWNIDEGQAAALSAIGSDTNHAASSFRQVTITPAIMGLTGPQGVLPRHYTQHLAERELYHRDTATRSFLDIFNSRAVALFYQAWLKYRLHLRYETDRKNHFLPLVLNLAGIRQTGYSKSPDRADLSEEIFAYYAAALREQPRSPQRCVRIISDYFGVQARIEQFVGQWLTLPLRERSCLGVANTCLGETTFCGSRTWVRDATVRIVLGPMRRSRFDDLLPGTAGSQRLRQMLRLTLGMTYDCEVRLVLHTDDVIPMRLSESLFGRLGWDSWVRTHAQAAHANDAAYRIASGT
ncbi:type VI secretion system baseplate subunit TssG [Noviherbaspirillum saxi]|uniref:Type VI secretion system baseplate subunit TssG n=1 Tax=Noviherbaspirillum saxi TaxID=2320863 RepID=A0A3A3FKX9_9BURK|nr:type VI secretion system baseplate subunit TssG [Noviherbaspirillum saxi]RJF95844.1 type VI secretion system baseplate subunit TssG [Noviherbaspirillum saxi]